MQINQESTLSTQQHKEATFLYCPYCKSAIPSFQFHLLNGNINIHIGCSCQSEYKTIPLSHYIYLIKEKTETAKQKCVNYCRSRSNSFCLQCQNWLCLQCTIYHNSQFQAHSLFPFEYHPICSHHQENLTLYCSKCNKDICAQCTSSHQGHSLSANSPLDVTLLSQCYQSCFENIIKQSNDLKLQFDQLLSTAGHLNDQEMKDIHYCSKSINSLHSMHCFTNNLLKEFLETLFDTVKLFASGNYNHNLETQIKSIQLCISPATVQLDQSDIKKSYLLLKDYYSNCFLFEQKHSSRCNYQSFPFIFELKEHTDSITTLTKLKDNLFASGSKDNSMKLWDSQTFKCLKTFKGHEDLISSIIQFNDNILISSSWDQTVRIWDINSSECLSTLKIHHQYVSSLLKLTSDLFISVSWNNFKVSSISTNELVLSFQGHSNMVNSLIDLNDRSFASCSWDKKVKIWDKKSFRCIKTLIGHEDFVYCLVKVRDDLLVSGSRDKTIKLWDLNTFECVGSMNAASAVVCLALLNGYILVSGSYDGSFTVWDYHSEKDIATFPNSVWGSSIKCLLDLGYNRLVCGANIMIIITLNY